MEAWVQLGALVVVDFMGLLLAREQAEVVKVLVEFVLVEPDQALKLGE